MNEDRHHAAAAAHHVAVAHAAQTGPHIASIGIAGNHQLFGRQFGSAVQIHRRDRFIGAERQDFFDTRIDGGIDHVAGSQDVGFDRFHGVVFAGRNLFEGRGVYDNIDILHSPAQTG